MCEPVWDQGRRAAMVFILCRRPEEKKKSGSRCRWPVFTAWAGNKDRVTKRSDGVRLGDGVGAIGRVSE